MIPTKVMNKQVATQESDMVISEVFNFHSIRSVMITKSKTKSSQTIDTHEYKIDTGSDDNLMPINMYKILFPNTNVIE